MAKYSDLPTVSVSTQVAASPSVLWPLISDIEVPVQFSDELQRAVWLAPADGPALGALFEGTNRHPAIGEWTVTCCVSVYEPERAFGWDPGGPEAPLATWRFTLDPDGATTTLRFEAQMGLGPSNLTPVIAAMPEREEEIVAGRLDQWRSNMAATVEGIKALAESEPIS